MLHHSKLDLSTGYPQDKSRISLGKLPLATFSYAFLAVLCSLALILAGCAVVIAVKRTASPVLKLRSIESRQASQDARMDELAETLKDLANRVKMMRVRTSINHVSDPPIAEEGSVKDRLRKIAGLRAGHPANHQ
jgi:hypothetical protein